MVVDAPGQIYGKVRGSGVVAGVVVVQVLIKVAGLPRPRWWWCGGVMYYAPSITAPAWQVLTNRLIFFALLNDYRQHDILPIILC